VILELDEGVRRWRIWHELAWNDIRQRYRRSIIGPFWITISLAIFIGTLGVLYSVLFKLEVAKYLPFLATGYVVWSFINMLVIESCQVFVEAEPIMTQVRVPLIVLVLRMVWRNVLIFLHSLPIVAVVMVMFSSPVGPAVLLFVPGFLLLCVTGVWVGLLLGIVCARFRDMPAIVQNLMQVLFFLTPIFWPPELVEKHPYLVEWNVVHHLVEIVRAPFLNNVPSAATWLTVLAVTVGGVALAWHFVRQYGRRVTHWL
jgi:ABC-type polysaccharide/polyol phosphate export permease